MFSNDATHFLALKIVVLSFSRLHPGIDLADLELPEPANLDGGHTAFFDPVEDRIAVDAEVGGDFFHGNPAFQIIILFVFSLSSKIQ